MAGVCGQTGEPGHSAVSHVEMVSGPATGSAMPTLSSARYDLPNKWQFITIINHKVPLRVS